MSDDIALPGRKDDLFRRQVNPRGLRAGHDHGGKGGRTRPEP